VKKKYDPEKIKRVFFLLGTHLGIEKVGGFFYLSG
jgi:hypothetical protein